MNKDTSITNPFYAIVAGLNDQWQKVTLEYLDMLSKLLEGYEVYPETYDDTFRVLEFLAEHGAIELQTTENEEHLIKRKQYLG